VLLVPAALALAAALLLGVSRLGDAAVRRSRCDAVADLTALAAVTGGDGGAREVAGANGTSVVRIAASGSTRTVTVSAAGVESTASAAPGPG
jgi:hypothetical protein